MDIEVMQRKLNDLTKFRDDLLALMTREGTLDAFNAMVAERRQELAARAKYDADAALAEAADAERADDGKTLDPDAKSEAGSDSAQDGQTEASGDKGADTAAGTDKAAGGAPQGQQSAS